MWTIAMLVIGIWIGSKGGVFPYMTFWQFAGALAIAGIAVNVVEMLLNLALMAIFGVAYGTGYGIQKGWKWLLGQRNKKPQD